MTLTAVTYTLMTLSGGLCDIYTASAVSLFFKLPLLDSYIRLSVSLSLFSLALCLSKSFP